MKRISLWALSTLSAVVLLFGYHTSTSGTMATTSPGTAKAGSYSASAPQATSGSSGGSGGGDGTDTSGATSGSSTTGSGSTTRTVTGQVAQTTWGPVQVQLEVTGSQVSNVTVLQYPSGNGKDQEINSYALPILTQETINAQGADIDMVSGATITSGGYVQSLQSALDQAGI